MARRPSSILARADVARRPLLVVALSAFAIAASSALRAPTEPVDAFTLAAAAVTGAIALGLMTIAGTSLGRRLRAQIWVYQLLAAGIVGALAVSSLRSDGVATPYFSALILVGGYLALISPPRARFGTIGALLLATGLVQLAMPAPTLADPVIVGALIVAGWAIGAMVGEAHERTARRARELSQFDLLARVLNRRGVLRQLHRLAGARESAPLALLIIDLDGFKAINDRLGHAAGDELLSWTGDCFAAVLPAEAEAGRLGGDEFAVLLPGTEPDAAEDVARTLRSALAARIGASIGVATSHGDADADTLLAVADAALYACKADRTLGVERRDADPVIGTLHTVPAPDRPSAGWTLSWARLRRRTRWPEPQPPGIAYSWMLAGSMAAIAGSGVFIVGEVLLGGVTSPSGPWTWMVTWLGVPWILFFCGLGVLAHRSGGSGGREGLIADSRLWTIYLAATIGLGGGLAVAMLAHGGLTTPIAAGLFAKVLSDAAIFPAVKARITLALMTFVLGFVALFGPASTLWVTPFGLAMLLGGYVLGAIGYRAFDELTTGMLREARTDPLTGIANRLGFEEAAHAAVGEELPCALLAIDLDDFKTVNDTYGHAAGDDLLRGVATALVGALPGAVSVARLGGDEFVALVPASSDDEARRLADRATEAVWKVAAASVGHAMHPADGRDLDALLHAADERSYERKRARKAARAATTAARAG